MFWTQEMCSYCNLLVLIGGVGLLFATGLAAFCKDCFCMLKRRKTKES